MICASPRLTSVLLRHTAQRLRGLNMASSKNQVRMPLLLGERRGDSYKPILTSSNPFARVHILLRRSLCGTDERVGMKASDAFRGE